MFLVAFSRWRGDKPLIFHSAENSGIDESVLDFLIADYIMDLVIHRYCCQQIFRINPFVFPCSYVGSFELEGCIADEKVVDCAKIEEMLRIAISITIVICHWYAVWSFSHLAFQFPVKNTSDFFELIQNSADIVADVLEYKNMIFGKLARWYVHAGNADNAFREETRTY